MLSKNKDKMNIFIMYPFYNVMLYNIETMCTNKVSFERKILYEEALWTYANAYAWNIELDNTQLIQPTAFNPPTTTVYIF